MSFRKTLVLALLVLGIGLYIKYFELPREQSKQTEQELLKGLRRENLKSVEIVSQTENFQLLNSAPQEQRESQAEVQVANDEFANWRLADLPGSKLESATLSALFTALEQLRLESSIPKQEISADLNVYGLDKPLLQIKIEDSAKRRTELSLGKQNEFISKRYLQLAGRDELYLVGEAIFSAASKLKKDYRDATPLEYLDSQLASLSIKDAAKTVKFEAAANGSWNISQPIKKPASASAISSLNMSIRNLSALEFIDQNPLPLAEKLLDPAQVSIELEFKPEAKRAPLNIALSAVKEKVGETEVDRGYMYLKDSNTIFKLASDPLAKIIKPVDDWREKKMFKFVSDQVVQADFQLEEGQQVSILKNAGSWQINGKPGDEVFILQLLRNLSELEALQFPLENRNFGLSLPILKVIVRLSASAVGEKPQDRVLVVGSKVQDDKSPEIRYYASVDDLSDVFIIKKETLDRITPKEEALVKPAPTATSAPTVESKT